jgi:ribosome-associated translation inhibitor RaiA
MLTAIRGLRGQRRLRVEVVNQLSELLERRRFTPVSVRVAFFDDDGPRGGVAIRCALTVRPKRGPTIRVEHTARTHSAAFNGGLAILRRQLKRHVQRRRRRARYPTRRAPSVARDRRAGHRPRQRQDEGK